MLTTNDYFKLTREERDKLKKELPCILEAILLESLLRPLAEKASPGPWYRSHGCITASMGKTPDGKPDQKPYWQRFLFNVERNDNLVGTEADARWVAAANPYSITKLLDVVISLREELERKNKKIKDLLEQQQFTNDVAMERDLLD